MMFLLSAERGPKRRCTLDGNRRKCAILVYLIFDLKALFGYSKNTYQTEAPFLLTIELFAGAAMLVRSSPTKSRKRLARGVVYTSSTHAAHVHDVTGLIKMAVLTGVISRGVFGVCVCVCVCVLQVMP